MSGRPVTPSRCLCVSSELLDRFTCGLFFLGELRPLYQVLVYFRCMWLTPNPNARDNWHRTRAKTQGCQFCNNYDNSVIAGPIMLKVRMCAGTHLTKCFHVQQLRSVVKKKIESGEETYEILCLSGQMILSEKLGPWTRWSPPPESGPEMSCLADLFAVHTFILNA